MAQLTIPDVSEFQGVIDWKKLVGGGYPAAIIRAHNGNRADSYFAANRSKAHANGIKALAMYQYVVANRDTAAQANELCDLVGALKSGEWLVCDLEAGTGDQSGRAHTWLKTVMSRLHDDGTAEELYSGESFYGSHNLSSAGFKRIWIAAYRSTEPTVHHELWQFTDAKTFPGIAHACDASIFHGTVADLLAHVNKPAPTPPPAPHYLVEENDMSPFTIAANVDVIVPVEPAGTAAKPQGGAKNAGIWIGFTGQGTGSVTYSFHKGAAWVSPVTVSVKADGHKFGLSLPTDGSVDSVKFHSTVALLAYVTGRQVA
jgi:lysozyme